MRASRKSLLTIRERVLLHLLSLHKYNQDADAPRGVTQDGIAQATDVGRNNITKVMNDLFELGYVELLSRHVKGLPSVRKVYFLSQKGFSVTLAFKREMESTRIVISDMTGRRLEDDVGKLQLYLPKQYGFLELVMGVNRGEFDCRSFHEGKIKEERRFVDYTDRKPTVRSFYGRARELQVLSQFLSSESKVMVIQGIAGIGKTTLLAKFVQDKREQTHIFWFKVHEWVDLKGFLRSLGEFLSQVGKKGLEWYLTQSERVTISEVCHVLETELHDVHAIWILDDVQKAEKGVNDLLSAMIGVLEAISGPRMICTTREAPSFYTRSAVIGGVVQELVLEGLDRESSLQLMRDRSLPEGELEDIYRATHGHPLFMELVEDPKAALGKNVRMFVEQEVYSKLEVNEKRILELASIFRYPVPTDSFFIMEEEISKGLGPPHMEKGYQDHMVDYDAIDLLLRKALLKESTSRLLGMHDVMRDFFYSRLAPRQRILYHRAASRYYLQDDSAPSRVEALYHSILANECEASVRIAAGNGRDIISKGYASLLSPLLDNLLSKCVHIDGAERMEILFLQAEILDIQGEWDQAMQRYQEISVASSSERDRRLKAEVNRRMGVIFLRRYDYEGALKHLYEARSLAESLNDEGTMAQVLYDIGGVMEREGAFKEAIECFRISEIKAASVGDDVSRGKALYGLGRAYAQKQDMDQAMAFKRSALEVLERTGDANGVAKVCSSLGSDLTNEGLTEEAIKFLERSVELADSIGDLNTLGYALTNLAGSYIEVGNLERAEANLDRAIQISQKLNERYIIATTHLYRGYLYHKRGEWEWAKDSYRTAIEELRAINAPTRLSYWLYEVAKVYVENADFEGALRYLNESHELALKNDQEKLRQQVEEIIQGISI